MLPDPLINPNFGEFEGPAGTFWGPLGKSQNQVFIRGFFSKSKKVYFSSIFDNLGSI